MALRELATTPCAPSLNINLLSPHFRREINSYRLTLMSSSPKPNCLISSKFTHVAAPSSSVTCLSGRDTAVSWGEHRSLRARSPVHSAQASAALPQGSECAGPTGSSPRPGDTSCPGPGGIQPGRARTSRPQGSRRGLDVARSEAGTELFSDGTVGPRACHLSPLGRTLPGGGQIRVCSLPISGRRSLCCLVGISSSVPQWLPLLGGVCA